MTASKPKQVGWCAANGEILSLSGKKQWLRLGGSLGKTAGRFDEPLIRLTDHEAAIAELRADRDQQYDMKVKAREQRDAVTAENQRLREALSRHICTGMTDAQRTAELDRYLSDGIAADKARIAELEKRSEGLLGLYREAESELKQCVIDRASFSDELRACTESPGGCGYWREAAKHRAGERDHALARIAELEAALMVAKQRITSGPYGAHPTLETIACIDATIAQQGKEGET